MHKRGGTPVRLGEGAAAGWGRGPGGRARCRLPVPAAEDPRPAHRGAGPARAPPAEPADGRPTAAAEPGARAPLRPGPVLTSRAIWFSASSSAVSRSRLGSRLRPEPCVPMSIGRAARCAAGPWLRRPRPSGRPAPLRPALRRPPPASWRQRARAGDAGTRGQGLGTPGEGDEGTGAAGTAGTPGRARWAPGRWGPGSGDARGRGSRRPGLRGLQGRGGQGLGSLKRSGGEGTRGPGRARWGPGRWGLESGDSRGEGHGSRAVGMRRRTREPGALGLQGPGIRALGSRGPGTPGDRERGDSGGLGPLGVREGE